MRRRVGSISLAGITGPEELELLEEEAQCESEVFVIFHHLCVVFFFKRRNGNRRSSSVFNRLSRLLRLIQSYNQSRAFQFPSFLTLIDLRHNSEQITDLAFSIPPAQHFRLAVTFFLKQWHWFRSPCKIYSIKFVNSLAKIDERLNIFSSHSSQGS